MEMVTHKPPAAQPSNSDSIYSIYQRFVVDISARNVSTLEGKMLPRLFPTSAKIKKSLCELLDARAYKSGVRLTRLVVSRYALVKHREGCQRKTFTSFIVLVHRKLLPLVSKLPLRGTLPACVPVSSRFPRAIICFNKEMSCERLVRTRAPRRKIPYAVYT